MADKTEKVKKSGKKSRKNREANYTFYVMVIALLAFGLVMVFSASSPRGHYYYSDAFYFVKKQALFAIVGVMLMAFFSKFYYKAWHKLTWIVGGVTLALLLGVAVMGTTGGGAQRWLQIGPVTMQPSEVAKFAVVVLMARLLSDYGTDMKSFKKFAVMMLVPVGFCGIVLLERHLSGAIIILVVGVILAYTAGAKLMHIVGCGLVALPFALLAIILEPFRLKRIFSFMDPFADMKDGGYQIVQSLYAIGSGGLFGVGLGQSREKYMYLPEAHTDFIFSVTCEELGFFGAMLVIVMFAILVVTGFKIAIKAPDRFSMYLATGFTSIIALQAVFNIAVVTSTIPCTGITLPFFSYGGSALIINLVEMGVVLNISRYAKSENRLQGGDFK